MSAPKKKATKKAATSAVKKTVKAKAEPVEEKTTEVKAESTDSKTVKAKAAPKKKAVAKKTATAAPKKKTARKSAAKKVDNTGFNDQLKKELDHWLDGHSYWNHDDWCHLLASLESKSISDLTTTNEGRDSIGLYLETNRKSVSA